MFKYRISDDTIASQKERLLVQEEYHATTNPLEHRVFAVSFEPFNWTCEYCGQPTTITEPNYHKFWKKIHTNESRFGNIGAGFVVVVCPNNDCNELTLTVQITKAAHSREWYSADIIQSFPLMPRSRAKPQPEYIPQGIRDNYLEACLISQDSPKASASMSRRCLQGMVRDYWNIPTSKRGNLGAELNYIKDKVTEDTWKAIQTVRSVGDIGAHMEKDVNIIVDVDSDEADLLVQLIETLLEDWYVERHKRTQRNKQLQALGEEKLRLKKAGKNSADQPENADKES